MNKTVNINLGGMFFHIDEDAYQKLSRYFDAIKRSLSDSNGQDEIIKDIEMRIAELVAEKHTSDKQVISLKELDEIIAIMGQPEDYRIEPDGEPTQNTYAANNVQGRTNKKLYRDKDTGMIGGVAAGLGHYFGIDAVWIRIFLVIMVIAGFGSGILAYIILWVVMPEAVTTSEKLEMKGEPITISNIEKKVKEEFEAVSEKIKNAPYDKMGNQVKTGVDKFTGSASDVLMTILKIFAKIIGVFLIISAMATLIMLFIGVFTLGTSASIDFPWQELIDRGIFTDYPVWVLGLIIFLAVGIPFFFLLLLGFKLLAPHMKSVGNIGKYTLLALWLISIAILISLGIRNATEFSVDGRQVKKERIALQPQDTLYIKFKASDYFSNHDDFESREFKITEDSTNTKVIYSGNVNLHIEKTDEKVPYIQVEKKAKGATLSKAKKTADQIKYSYKFEGNKLILDNYLLTDFKNKFRDQRVDVYVYLPEGTLFKADKSVQEYDESDDAYFNLHFSSDKYLYKVAADKVICTDCPADENDWDDLPADQDSITGSIEISKDGILIKKEKNDPEAEKTKKIKAVKVNENGITIKTE
ncbi:MAG: PspC domain-containing protein [Flavobacteriaceae bacterium]